MPSFPARGAARARLALTIAGALALAAPLGCAAPPGPGSAAGKHLSATGTGGALPSARQGRQSDPPVAPGDVDPDTKARVLLRVADPRITESSGLAASRRHRGVLYTHNDSGGRPQIYAVGPDGKVKATITLAGAAMRDWEGIAAGRDEAGRPALYVADIGDNLGGAWPYVTVYRIPEPAALRSQTLRARAYRLKYADGPRDAEAVLINPKSNRLYVVSKLLSGRLYAAPKRLRAGRANVLREVGPAPTVATDAAYAPDGRTFAIRTYFSVNIYTAPGKVIETVRLPEQEQGESITYAADGRSLLVGSEFARQPVWQVPLPEEALPVPTADPKARPGAADQDGGPGRDTGSKALILVVAAGLASAAVAAALRRRSG